MPGLFIFTCMMGRYLLASFFGALIGAACVLITVYVTNAKALVILAPDVNEAVSSLHSRINDFYIFAGIVITLLLAINVGVYVKTDEEVDRQLRKNIAKYEKKIERLLKKSKRLLTDLKIFEHKDYE
jgi:hypothetical protein